EGELVEVSVAFTDTGSQDTHTCTIDYGDGSAPEDGTVDQAAGTCTGQHTYRDDASEPFTITITVTDDAEASARIEVKHTVENVDPTIERIELGPVRQGEPVLVTVAASDPGDEPDPLTYRLDCDGDGDGDIGPQEESTASCALDPSRAQTTITVLVEDDDGGSTTGAVTVRQSLPFCANRYTGQLGATLATGSCPPASTALTLPAEDPETLCIQRYTGELTWSPRGACSSAHTAHMVPDDGPLPYGQNRYPGALRYSLTGACTSVERPGVIPGL